MQAFGAYFQWVKTRIEALAKFSQESQTCRMSTMNIFLPEGLKSFVYEVNQKFIEHRSGVRRGDACS
jgi:hypothetical protein